MTDRGAWPRITSVPAERAVATARWSAVESVDESFPQDVLLRSGDGLCVVTLLGRIIFWNEAAEELLGVPRDRAVGRLLADLSRTPESWEANWGHHVTTVGAHLSGNPPVRRVLRTVDNRDRRVEVHISSTLFAVGSDKPQLLYSFTVTHLPTGTDDEPFRPLGLTTREWEVSCLLMSGLGTGEIASELGIAYATVRAHIRNILVTLGANTRTQALMRLWSRYGTPEAAGFPRPGATDHATTS